MITQLDHLTGGQKQLLKNVLDKHTVLFNGKLGCYTGEKVHLELIDNPTPSWKRAYPVPFTRERAFKNELDEMVKKGSIERCHEISEWAAPSFIIPKQDETVRVINDFREFLRFVFVVVFIKEIFNKSKML